MKPKEVGPFEFDHLLKTYTLKAKRNAQRNGAGDYRWWLTEDEAKDHAEAVPCIYELIDRYHDLICPINPEKQIPRRKLPTAFRKSPKEEVIFLSHYSDTYCIGINLKTKVTCLAQVDTKYYVHEHKAGKCPWKKARTKTK